MTSKTAAEDGSSSPLDWEVSRAEVEVGMRHDEKSIQSILKVCYESCVEVFGTALTIRGLYRCCGFDRRGTGCLEDQDGTLLHVNHAQVGR